MCNVGTTWIIIYTEKKILLRNITEIEIITYDKGLYKIYFYLLNKMDGMDNLTSVLYGIRDLRLVSTYLIVL